MKLEELAKKRLIEGAKEHDGTGTGDWANWGHKRFISAAQEELADAFNYINHQKVKEKHQRHDIEFMAIKLIDLFNSLEVMKR